MRIKTIKKKALLISLLIIALVTAGIFYAFSQDDEMPSQPTANGAAEQNGPENQTTPEPTELPSKPDVGNNNQPASDNISVTISHLSQDTSTIYLRAFVEGATNGTCTAKFEKSGASPVVRSAPTAASGETYVCQGFNVPKSSFSSKGAWTVIVSFSGNNKSGISNAKTISIN